MVGGDGGGNGNGNGGLWRHGLSCCHTFRAGEGFFWSVLHGSPVFVADGKLVRVDGWMDGMAVAAVVVVMADIPFPFFPLLSFVFGFRRFS